MKTARVIILLLAAILAHTARAQKDVSEQYAYIFTSFHEPSTDGMRYLYSYDGLKWDTIPGVFMRPEIGNDKAYIDAWTGESCIPNFAPEDKVLRDPSMVQGPDGTYHLVWTTQWMGSKGFGYAHSKDLKHWSKQVEIPVMEGFETNNVWAPELFYDDDLKLYFIIWSSQINPKDRTAEDNKGQNSANRLWYCTTKDFKRFSKAQPYFDPGFNSIDGFLLKKGKGDYVLIVKDNRKPGYSNLFCAFSDSAYGPFHTEQPAKPQKATELMSHEADQPFTTFGRTFSEGPCAVNLGSEWVIYYDQYRPQGFGAVSTKDFRTFTPIPERISVPEAHKHGTIVKVKRAEVERLISNY